MENHSNQEQHSSEDISSQNKLEQMQMDPNRSLGLSFGFSPSGAVEFFTHIYGSVGRIDITIINSLPEDVDLQFQNGNKSPKPRETLKSGLTRVIPKKPRDGLILKPDNYKCEFWTKDKHAQIFVFGENAPHKSNIFDLREDGLYLLAKKRDLLMSRWEEMEIDTQSK